MNITLYQIIVPLVSLLACAYAWNLVVRQKKTLWEAMLWTIFWGGIAVVAMFPQLLGYLSALTGIKDQVNAIFVTSIGVLFFLTFLIIVRLEELEQRMTRIVRQAALREANAREKQKEG